MSAPARSLEGKVVALTGASRGIGHALATCLLSQGATVMASARTVPKLPDSPRAFAASVDVTSQPQLEAWAASLGARASGRCDILIHNASILGPTGPLETLDAARWRQTLEVNLTGAFLTTQHLLPLLEAAPDPLVVYLSSSVGRQARAEWGAYCASKFGLEALMGMLAQERPRFGVVSFNPGGTRTQMRAEAYPHEDPSTLPEPQKIAQTLAWLCTLLTPEHSGRAYNARDLFDLVGTLPDALPHA